MGRIEHRKTRVQSWFMDVNLVRGYWAGQKRSYHHTAPINPLYGLHESLLILQEEGLKAAWERHRRHHLALKAGLEAMGLEMAVDEAIRLPQLNAVRVPDGVDDVEARARLLAEHGLEIGAGLGEFAGRVWRIGLMGHSARRENVLLCLWALESVLSDMGGAVEAGAAGKAAEAVLAG
jgi:alanine-glyoxylate transaminase/serine-glyoxylate transaminase/serine-pyruvate transaminase